MALRGNLTDFTLPDVFQLIALSKKTGVLRMRRADGSEGNVWFRNGEVFFAESNWHRERLGERLVTAQKITPSALARALQLRAAEPSNGRRLGRILVDEGYITDAVLEAFVRDQVLEPIFDLMRWEEGDFDFETAAETPEEDIGLAVSIENIVMEGARRLEEWERIKKKIPSMDLVFKMATAPGEGSFEISLKPVEWNLLLLVDGTRSVAELARAAHWTEFDAARVVYGLYSAGLLEVAGDEEVARLRAERAKRDARSLVASAAVAGPVRVSAPGAEPVVSAEPGPVAPAQVEPPPIVVAAPAPPAAAPATLEPAPPEAARVPAPPEAGQAAPAAPMPTPASVAPMQPVIPPQPGIVPAAGEAEPALSPEVAVGVSPVTEAEPVPVPVRVVEPASVVEPMSAAEAAASTGSVPLGERVPFVEAAEEGAPLIEPEEVAAPEWTAPPVTHSETLSFVEEEAVLQEEIRHGAPPETEEAGWGAAEIQEDLAVLGLLEVPPTEKSNVEPEMREVSAAAGASYAPETPRAEAVEPRAQAEAEEEAVAPMAPMPTQEPALLDTHGDAGLRSALTDEITALTGVERVSRPAVSPEADTTSAVPRRDARIDRETLLDIIEGIKGL
jgi:hypothetical protein